MDWDVHNNVQRLSIHLNPNNIRRLKGYLDESGTLSLTPNERYIYSASSGLNKDDSSGYQHAWLRDNVMIAYSKWFCGNRKTALRTVHNLQKVLQNQLWRFQKIIGMPNLKEDISNRPRVRFNAETLEELPEDWADAQNDALGAVIWLRFLMANQDTSESSTQLTMEECALYQHMLRYLKAIEYWADQDSGVWEEVRKVNSSSVGAVLAGLKQIMLYSQKCVRPDIQILAEMADKLYKSGAPVLAAQLPFESPPARKSDAALLFLIFPFAIVSDMEMQDQILSLVRAKLMGPLGIRRYVGDSYYCQNYDEWFPPLKRSADFSKNIEFRDELLIPGQEAQWCLFDPILSTVYGLRSNKDLQILHFQRSIRQLTKDLKCPELYYSKNGLYIPNHHTPLAWTQANLAVALQVLETSIQQ